MIDGHRSPATATGLRKTSAHDTVSEVAGIPRVTDIYADRDTLEGVYPADLQIHANGTRSYVVTDLLLPTQEFCRSKGWDNFDIVTDQLATRVMLESGRATGVEVIDGARAYRVDAAHRTRSLNAPRRTYRANREIILSGGAINTPQLLMLSGIGPSDHLSQVGVRPHVNLPGVGRHLQDHLECTVNFEILNLPGRIFPYQAMALSMINPWWRRLVTAETKSSFGSFAVADCFSGIGERDPLGPDLHMQLFNVPFRDFNCNPRKYRDPDPLRRTDLSLMRRAINPFFPTAYQAFMIEVMRVQNESGEIRLRSNDPTEQPIIDERLADSDEDVARLAAGVDLCRRFMAAPGMTGYRAREILPGPEFSDPEATREYIRNYSAFGHHIAGTCKMGSRDDPSAVVDHNLHVRGLQGLRICDASIFPSIPGYNTSRPTYMAAEILAEKMRNGA
jgi:choline dehydrogenase